MPDYTQFSDTQLIDACRAGKPQAWQALVDRYRRLVYTIPIRYGLPSSEADDVFQKVWLRLLEHLPTLNQPDRLSAWLVTTARRECWARRRGASYERESSIDPDNLPLNKWVDEQSPEKIASRYDQHRRLEEAKQQLDERCHRLLDYLYKDELSYKEIAHKLSLKTGAIGPTRARCLQKLRQLLEP